MDKNNLRNRIFEHEKMAFEFIMNTQQGRNVIATILSLADPRANVFCENDRVEAFALGQQNITREILKKLEVFGLDSAILLMNTERKELLNKIKQINQKKEEF